MHERSGGRGGLSGLGAANEREEVVAADLAPLEDELKAFGIRVERRVEVGAAERDAELEHVGEGKREEAKLLCRVGCGVATAEHEPAHRVGR